MEALKSKPERHGGSDVIQTMSREVSVGEGEGRKVVSRDWTGGEASITQSADKTKMACGVTPISSIF